MAPRRKNNKATRKKRQFDQALARIEKLETAPPHIVTVELGREPRWGRFLKLLLQPVTGFAAIVSILGYYFMARPDMSIGPYMVTNDKGNGIVVPFELSNDGWSSVTVEVARCSGWQLTGADDDWRTGMPPPGEENCTTFSGPKIPVLARKQRATLWPCLESIDMNADRVEAVFMVRVRTVGWLWWPWEVTMRDAWRYARSGKVWGWYRGTPFPSPQDNFCSDEVMKGRGRL